MFGVTINIKGAKEYNDVDDDDNYIESNIVESDFGRKHQKEERIHCSLLKILSVMMTIIFDNVTLLC